MIKDYGVYKLTGKEKSIVYAVGYLSIGTIFFLYYNSILLALISGVLVRYIVPYVEKHMAKRQQDALNTQFKDMLYSLSASVAAGRQMEEAIIEAEENLATMYKPTDLIMKELKHMRVSIVENNENDKILLKDFATRSKSEDINDFVQVYITCRNLGGDLEKIIAQASDILMEKMVVDRDIKVLTAQKKNRGKDNFIDAYRNAFGT